MTDAAPTDAAPSEESRHLSVFIDRPAAEVYDFVSQPANLPRWAAGLASSLEFVEGRWTAQSPLGPVVVEMTEPNRYGIVDHQVTLPDGQSFYNPMRVIPAGERCELVFTLRRQPGTTDADFERDAAAVTADLATVQRLLQAR